MSPSELLPLLFESLRGHKLRSFLTMLGIVVGIASVVLLSSIGEGTRQGIASQFAQFGTTLVSIVPGKEETFGMVGTLGGTTRRLTFEDLKAIERTPGVRAVNGSVYGTALVEFEQKGRNVYINGCLHTADDVWKWPVRVGQFLPETDPRSAPLVTVLGQKLTDELFDTISPLGEFVRIGGTRFRVIGIMERKGTFLGMDLDDAAMIPATHAMRIFNRFELNEVHVDVSNHDQIDRTVERVRSTLMRRHDDEEDFTIVTQAAMLDVINDVMDIVTRGVIAIAGIAIFVGAMGILTVTWLSVHERTAEIGLMKAIGASRGQVMSLFLGEAMLLSVLGGLIGVGIGVGLGELIELAVPALRIETAPGIIPINLAVALVVGGLAGWLPARKAASLNPIDALREE